MTDIFLGIAIFGVIVWASSFSLGKDRQLYKSYLRKTRSNERTSLSESTVYWTYRFVAVAPTVCILVGISGLLLSWAL